MSSPDDVDDKRFKLVEIELAIAQSLNADMERSLYNLRAENEDLKAKLYKEKTDLTEDLGWVLKKGIPRNLKRVFKSDKFQREVSKLLFMMLEETRHRDPQNDFIPQRVTKAIAAIYGICGALDNSSSYSRRSPWLDIFIEVRKLASKGIDLLSLVKKKVGNGEATSFWNDVWLGDFPLKQTYLRLYFLELDKHVSVASKLRANSLISSFRQSP
ncbi:hypothetical protein Tco_1293308 [Tanacetum coccineum]